MQKNVSENYKSDLSFVIVHISLVSLLRRII